MCRALSAGPLPGPAVPLGDLSSRHDTVRLSQTPGEPSGCDPSPARRRPALLLFGQGAGTQGITPLSGPPPSALNGERGGGVTPRAMAARPRPRHPPRRWRALGRTEEPSWSRRVTQSCLLFYVERSVVSLHPEGVGRCPMECPMALSRRRREPRVGLPSYDGSTTKTRDKSHN